MRRVLSGFQAQLKAGILVNDIKGLNPQMMR
jgi:hypothetical protein